MKIDQLNKPIHIPKEIIEEWISNRFPEFIKEVAVTQGFPDDGPNSFFGSFSAFNNTSKKRAEEIGYTVFSQIMDDKLEDYNEYPIYPTGPVGSNSYFPAGVIGKLTTTNQADITNGGFAYEKWFDHVTRTMALAGYELLQLNLSNKEDQKHIKFSGRNLKKDITAKPKERVKESTSFLSEEDIDDITTDIMDELMMGYEGKEDQEVRKEKLKTLQKKLDNTKTGNEKYTPIKEDIKFIKKSLNVPRHKMPQIFSKDMKDYVSFLKKNGVTVKSKRMPVKSVYMTQKEINTDKIKDLMGAEIKNLDKPVVISNDNYILDGHHRVVAILNIDSSYRLTTIWVDLSIKELLEITKEYPKVSFKSVNENVITESKKKLKLTIPKNVKDIHSAFKKEGKKLYIVGGAVRDAILGKKPKDFDLATDAKPDEVLQIAKKYKMQSTEVGKAFGVVVVNGEEVATFRKDIGKGRRPDAVDYTDIEGDVKRRDLTINALFYDLDREEIVDLVGGIKDLENNSIRTVGKAIDRFNEDPLRKLRTLRFASRLGGKIEKTTMDALIADPSLNGVSPERIRDEFIKSIQSAKSTKQYLLLADKVKILEQIFPNQQYSKRDFIDNNDHRFIIAYLFRSRTPKQLYKYLTNRKYTSDEANDIKFLLMLQHFTPDNIFIYKRLQENVTLTDSEIKEWGKLIGTDFSKFIRFKLSVKGEEVMKMGYKGKEIGQQISKMETEKFLNGK